MHTFPLHPLWTCSPYLCLCSAWESALTMFAALGVLFVSSIFCMGLHRHVGLLHAIKWASLFADVCKIVEGVLCNCARRFFNSVQWTVLHGQAAVFLCLRICFALGCLVASAYTSIACRLFLPAILSPGFRVCRKCYRLIYHCASIHNRLVYSQSHLIYWSCPTKRGPLSWFALCAQNRTSHHKTCKCV